MGSVSFDQEICELPISISDPLIRLTDALPLFPYEPCLNTLYRWARNGFKGVRLQTLAVGSTLFTTEAAVREFIEATSRARERALEEVAS